MPTYAYACTSCGERLEVVQKFTDDPLTVCPACAGVLRKVFTPVGVVFKGSGFYKTDSRPASSASKAESSETAKPAAKADGAKSEPAAAKTDSAPKPAEKAAPSTGTSSSDRVA